MRLVADRKVTRSDTSAPEVGRDDVHETWQKLTDPKAFQPELPLSFRDAYELVLRRGTFLGRDEQVNLTRRLHTVPTAKVARQVRAALRDGAPDEQRIRLVREVLDKAGIEPPEVRESLPDVQPHEIRLVTWMAVRGTRDVDEEMA